MEKLTDDKNSVWLIYRKVDSMIICAYDSKEDALKHRASYKFQILRLPVFKIKEVDLCQ